jgi:hypothetical protein
MVGVEVRIEIMRLILVFDYVLQIYSVGAYFTVPGLAVDVMA